MSNYIKQVFYENDDFTITLEEVEGNLMVHVSFDDFNRDILNAVLNLWTIIKDRAYWQGYEQIYTYTREPRMFSLFKDGHKKGEFEKDGFTYEVWEWELN